MDEERAPIDPDLVTRFESDSWGRCASQYLDTFAALTNQSAALLIEAAGVGKGRRVLEVGSGPGNLAGEFAARGADFDGIDFSAEMVEVAQQNHPGLRFRQANAEELPFDAESFDSVVGNFVVHHLARPGQVFKEVQRVLKPGGTFAFSVWGPQEQQSSFAAFFAAFGEHQELGDLPHGPLFGITDREAFEPLMEEAGMESFELSIHEVHWRAERLESVLRGLWDWGNLAALPEDLQAKIEASTRANSEPFREEGGYSFPHTVLLGRATRPD